MPHTLEPGESVSCPFRQYSLGGSGEYAHKNISEDLPTTNTTITYRIVVLFPHLDSKLHTLFASTVPRHNYNNDTNLLSQKCPMFISMFDVHNLIHFNLCFLWYYFTCKLS